MIDIRSHIRAIAHRDLLAQRMRGRVDIIKWAPALIAAQDDPGSDAPIVLSGLEPPFPSTIELAEALISRSELLSDGGLPVPGGVRHSLIHWSPVLQFARLRSDGGEVAGRMIEEVPRTFSMLAAWLERSMGLRPAPGGTPSRGYDLEEVLALFRKRFTFSIDEYARWLISVRDSDPALYLLLLSREYRMALRHCPELGDAPPSGSLAAVAMPGLVLPPILAAMTVGELQRLAALMHDLATRTGQTVRTIVDEVDDRRQSVERRGRRIAGAISAGGPPGFLYDHAPMRVEAIRKRVFLLSRCDASTLDKDSFLRAILGGRADWNHARSAGRHAGARELIASMLAPEIFKKRVQGKGLGHHNDPLDLYYGVPASELPYAALTELGLLFLNTQGRDVTSPIADRIRAITGRGEAATAGTQERKHRSAVKRLPLYLRPYPKLGSGGRFVAVAWLEPTRDAALFDHLLRPVSAIDPRTLRTRTRWMFPVALRYLQLSFPRLYEHVRVHEPSARIMAHLATSSAAITSDPIFYSLLTETISKMPKPEKLRSHFVKRPPSSPIIPLSQEIIDRVRSD